MADTLYRMVRRKAFLKDKAWPTIRRSGLRSKSPDTQDAIKSFASHAEESLRRIQRQLQRGSFKFGPAKAVAIPKKSSGYRPLVVPEIPSRIVQRSILEVLKTQPPVKAVLAAPGSYGTRRQSQVRHAIRDIWRAAKRGATHYVRSDIKEFFTHIPRLKVLRQLEQLLPDDSLTEILKESTWFELDELPSRLVGLFPSYDEGVAQGSCLSPLLGNILLRGFDEQMTAGQVQTLRYVDDFIMLGTSQEAVERAFATAQGILADLGMEAHNPKEGTGKASHGLTARKFEFLGCSISAGFVQPSKEARNSFLKRVEKELRDGARRFRREEFDGADAYEHSLLRRLSRVSRMIEAWSNHYDFCNALQMFEKLDTEVDQLLAECIGAYTERRNKLGSEESRRLLGVRLARDGRRRPIGE